LKRSAHWGRRILDPVGVDGDAERPQAGGGEISVIILEGVEQLLDERRLVLLQDALFLIA
jgi:hypothetical protein